MQKAMYKWRNTSTRTGKNLTSTFSFFHHLFTTLLPSLQPKQVKSKLQFSLANKCSYMGIVHNSSVWWDVLLMAEDILFSRFLDKLDFFKCRGHVYWNRVLILKQTNKKTPNPKPTKTRNQTPNLNQANETPRSPKKTPKNEKKTNQNPTQIYWVPWV